VHYDAGHPSNKLQRAREVAFELGDVAVRTLYRMAAKGEIPSYRVGKAGVRFNAAEVREALRRQVSENSTIPREEPR
jgi:excisionase family DNA binding protein